MSTINLEQYKEWIIKHRNPTYELQEESDGIRLITDYARAEIDFVQSMGYDIVQMQIISSKDNETAYYMHFELLDDQRAFDLYNEMESVMEDLKNQQDVEVLLSCSGGLTTSYFESLLNETSKQNHKGYRFQATEYSSLFEKADDYKIILLAPQIRYNLNEVRKIYPGKIVEAIDTKVFGTYDCIALFNFLDELLKTKKENKEEENNIEETKPYKGNILTVSFVIRPKKVETINVLYLDGKPVKKDNIIKKFFDNFDMVDIVKGSIPESEKLDCIAVSAPGVITDKGVLTIPGLNLGKVPNQKFTDLAIKEVLEKEFNVPVLVNNSTDMALLGAYESQKDYQSIVYLSRHSDGGVGQSAIYKGIPIDGRNHFAGELAFCKPYLKDGHNVGSHNPKNTVKELAQYIAMNIIILEPEAIYIRCPLTPDTSDIRKRLLKVFEEKYIPDLIYVSSDTHLHFMVAGNYMQAINYLKETSDKS